MKGLRFSWLSFILLLLSKSGLTGDSQCSVDQVHQYSTVPRGGLNVSKIEDLSFHASTVSADTLSAEYCIQTCCELGPSQCQYLWVIWGSCLAVVCQPGLEDLCEPVAFTTSSTLESIYVKMVFQHREGPAVNSGRGRVASPTGNPAGRGDKVEDMESSDFPPRANGGGDKVVLFPENSVVLNGEKSTDDEGVLWYLWQLVEEDPFSEAELVDPTSPALQVLHLTPGRYTFTLTVMDTNYQIDHDTVIVHVLPQAHPFAATPTGNSAKNVSVIVESNVTLNYTASVANDNTNMTIGIEQRRHSDEDYYSKKTNSLKIVVPVLVCLLFILFISAVIVGITGYLCDRRNRNRRVWSYRYTELPRTLEKI